MPARPLKLRAFLEGVEIPVISAMVSVHPNSAASASIQIVPADSVNELKPRSLVFLFFYDYYGGRSPSFGLTHVAGRPIEPPVLENYKLLFAGEIFGTGYRKQANQRSMVLQCLDFSNYWDTCWYFKGKSIFSLTGGAGKFADGASGTLSDLFASTGEMIFKVLKGTAVGYESYVTKNKEGQRVVHSQIPGLLGGIVALLQAIGGIYKSGTKRKGVSLFFSLAELRLKLSQQLGVYPDDGPLRLMKHAGFGSIWNKSIKGLGKQFNFRMAVNALQRYIFYGVCPNPTAKYIPATGKFSASTDFPYMLKSHPLYKVWVDNAMLMAKSITDWRTKMEDGEQLEFVEVLDGLKQMMQSCKKWKEDANQLKVPKASGCFAGAHTSLKQARNFISPKGKPKTVAVGNLPAGSTTTYTQKTVKVAKGIPKYGTKRHRQWTALLNKAENHLRKLFDMAAPGHKAEIGDSHPEFLYSQLFIPDTWFCSPPRCNVIFPDQYTSLSYNRQFSKEITRLMLRVGNTLVGYDRMIDNYLYAPRQLAVMTDKEIVKTKKDGIGPRVIRDLLEHELYTGVIPHKEKAKGLKIFGLKGNIVEEGTYRIGYMQRLCNFLFFKYRYAGRTLTVSGPFNPFPVCGFPAIIIDKPPDRRKAREIAIALAKQRNKVASKDEIDLMAMYSGTHYMGQITAITHSLSQDGGNTELMLNYARTHNEEASIIGSDIMDKPRKLRKLAKKPKKSIVAALNKPKFGGRGLWGGEIVALNEVPDAKGPYPILGTTRTRKTMKKKTGFISEVATNVEKLAREFGAEAVSLAGNPDASIMFKAYVIVEEVPKSEENDDFEIPFERKIMPAWYGNCWLNEQIGAVYQELLGIGAITDPITVGNTGMGNVMSEGEIEAIIDQETAEDESGGSTAVMTLDTRPSIKEAVNYLANVYSHVKTGGFDTDEFIRSYVWRPVATMTDIMGTRDLAFDEEGKVTEGMEGFFSRAFGDYKDLFLLVDEGVASIFNIERGEDAASEMDVRRERWLRALAYISELSSRGIRG